MDAEPVAGAGGTRAGARPVGGAVGGEQPEISCLDVAHALARPSGQQRGDDAAPGRRVRNPSRRSKPRTRARGGPATRRRCRRRGRRPGREVARLWHGGVAASAVSRGDTSIRERGRRRAAPAPRRAGRGDAERRAAHRVEPESHQEVGRRRVAGVLAAGAELDVGLDRPGGVAGDADELADARPGRARRTGWRAGCRAPGRPGAASTRRRRG